jgi:hypothetical protein
LVPVESEGAPVIERSSRSGSRCERRQLRERWPYPEPRVRLSRRAGCAVGRPEVALELIEEIKEADGISVSRVVTTTLDIEGVAQS